MAKVVNNLERQTLLPGKEEPPSHTLAPSYRSSLPPDQAANEAFVKPDPEKFLLQCLQLLPSIPLDSPNPVDILAQVQQLGNLSAAIQVFNRSFDELQKHFDFIDKAIGTRSNELAQSSPTIPPPAPNTCATSTAITHAQSKLSVTTELGSLKDNNLESHDGSLKGKAEAAGGSVPDEEVKSLCKLMCSRGPRGLIRYIVWHQSDTAKLREQLPLALKSAPKPAKFVLDAVGGFYLNGSNTFANKKSREAAGRDASIFILECFLLSGCVDKEVALNVSVKNEANSAAIAWRKRLVAEGGLAKAGQIDARGLLMLIAGFGIPASFKAEDLTDIILLSNASEIAHALRKSHELRVRIPDIIEGIIKKGLTVEAVDIIYTFELEEKFSPQTILTSFLRKSGEAWEKVRQKRDGSFSLEEANEKYLAALKSVLNCLEVHEIDCMQLLPGWKIKEKIANMMEDIADSSKKMEENVSLKRKMDQIESSDKLQVPETKHSKLTTKGSSPASPPVSDLQHQQTSAYVEGRSLMEEKVSQKKNIDQIEFSNKLQGLETKHSILTAEGSSPVSPSVSALQHQQTYVYVEGRSLMEEKVSQKRKIDQIESLNKLQGLETKHSILTAEGSSPVSPSVSALQQQQTFAYVEGRSLMEEKVSKKRKIDQIESLKKLQGLETKHLILTASSVSPSVSALQHQQTFAYFDDRSLQDASKPESLLETVPSSCLQNYPVALAAQMESPSGALLESCLLVDGDVTDADQIGCGTSAGTRVIETESTTGCTENMERDNVGMTGNNGSTSSRWCGVREMLSYNDGPFGQSFAGSPTSARANRLLVQLPSLKGFAGLLHGPSTGVSNHCGSTDLYSFVDAVVESDCCGGK